MKLRRANVETLINLIDHHGRHPWRNFTMEDREGNNLELNSTMQAEVIHKTVQCYIHDVATDYNDERYPDSRELRKIQAFTGTPDLPVLTHEVFNVTTNVNEFDTFWQDAYRSVELAPGELEWEIGEATSPITMEIIPEGGEVKIYRVTGETRTAKCYLRGAGLGNTWLASNNRKIFRFIDMMELARASYYKTWADVHYGLLATASKVEQSTGVAGQVTWQQIPNSTADTDGKAVYRDIATIDEGYYRIGNAVKDKAYSGEVANTEMLLYTNPRMRGRINNALRQIQNPESDIILNSSIRPMYTYSSKIPADKGILVLPGNKIQNAIYLPELGLSERRIMSLDSIYTYWTAFGAIVADTDQVVELSFSGAST